MAQPVAMGISGMDMILAIVAAIACLAAAGSTAFLITLFKPMPMP
jgi:anaerobic C4-dicarboxylate transporter